MVLYIVVMLYRWIWLIIYFTHSSCSFSEHMQLFHPEHADDVLRNLGREVIDRGGGAEGVAGAGGGGG